MKKFYDNLKPDMEKTRLGAGLYYSSVFCLALFDSAMQETLLFRISGVQIYFIDVYYFIALLAMTAAAFKGEVLRQPLMGKWYGAFILWLLAAIVLGIPAYGYRAFGEARYVFPLFGFFIPLVVFSENTPGREEMIRTVIARTIMVSAAAAALSFLFTVIQLWMGNLSLNEGDFRGLRFVSGNQTFYLLLLVCFLAIRAVEKGSLSWMERTALVGALLMAIFSKNRTPFVSFGVVLALYFILRVKVRRLLVFAALFAFLLWSIFIVLPGLGEQVDRAFGGIFNPEEDPTAVWRMNVQVAAFEQALETPWIGQGFGGYFSFALPEYAVDQPYDAIPHNQFVTLFLKTGLVGVFLSVAVIVAFSAVALRLRGGGRAREADHALVTTLLVLVSSQLVYGLAYDFFPLFGLYYGLGTVYFRNLMRRDSSEGILEPTSART